MSRGRQASVEQRKRIERLVGEGHGATAIYHQLKEEDLLADPHPGLQPRTIQRMVQKIKQRDLSGPWSFRDASPHEASLVLDVLLDVYEMTEGRVWLTTDIAQRVAKLREAVPNLSGASAYWFAHAYQALGEEGDTRWLDLNLAMVGWPMGRERDGARRLLAATQLPIPDELDAIYRVTRLSQLPLTKDGRPRDDGIGVVELAINDGSGQESSTEN